MFLEVLNTVFLNISNYLPHLEIRNRSIQIVIITNFVVITNVGIKRFDCNLQYVLKIKKSHILVLSPLSKACSSLSDNAVTISDGIFRWDEKMEPGLKG